MRTLLWMADKAIEEVDDLHSECSVTAEVDSNVKDKDDQQCDTQKCWGDVMFYGISHCVQSNILQEL